MANFTDHAFYHLETQKEKLIDALEYATSQVGQHINSLDIWMRYIDFLIDLSLQNKQKDHSKYVSIIRAKFNEALNVSISGYDILLNKYKRWEEYNSNELAGNLIPIVEQKCRTTKINFKTRFSLHNKCVSNKKIIFPSDPNAQQLIKNWESLINFEKENKEQLNTKSLFKRISFTYKLCLNNMTHFPKFYKEYVEWLHAQLKEIVPKISENSANTGTQENNFNSENSEVDPIEEEINNILENCLKNNFYNSDSIILVYQLLNKLNLSFKEIKTPFEFLQTYFILDSNLLETFNIQNLNNSPNDTSNSVKIKKRVLGLILDCLFYECSNLENPRNFYLELLQKYQDDLSSSIKILKAAILFELKTVSEKETALNLLGYCYNQLGKAEGGVEIGIKRKFEKFNFEVRSHYFSNHEVTELNKMYSIGCKQESFSKKTLDKDSKFLLKYQKNIPILFSSEFFREEDADTSNFEEGEIIDKTNIVNKGFQLGNTFIKNKNFTDKKFGNIIKLSKLITHLTNQKQNFQGISVDINKLTDIISRIKISDLTEISKKKNVKKDNEEKEAQSKFVYDENKSFFMERILGKQNK